MAILQQKRSIENGRMRGIPVEDNLVHDLPFLPNVTGLSPDAITLMVLKVRKSESRNDHIT
jgi:hypothetical protein